MILFVVDPMFWDIMFNVGSPNTPQQILLLTKLSVVILSVKYPLIFSLEDISLPYWAILLFNILSLYSFENLKEIKESSFTVLLVDLTYDPSLHLLKISKNPAES